MKKKEIFWNQNGWTTLQDADEKKHILEISCFSDNGNVTEIRMRHNDGEEECFKKKIDDTHSLPMPFETFKAAFLAGEILSKR